MKGDLCLGGSETNGTLAEIVDGVPFSEESVTEDGQWAYGLREILRVIVSLLFLWILR